MIKWFVLLLVAANLGLFLWGWSQDRPMNPPLPPLPATPNAIRLLSELPVPASVPSAGDPGSSLEGSPAAAGDDGAGRQAETPTR